MILENIQPQPWGELHLALSTSPHSPHSPPPDYVLYPFFYSFSNSVQDECHFDDEPSKDDLDVGGGTGCLNFPLPIPFNPGSRPIAVGFHPFALF